MPAPSVVHPTQRGHTATTLVLPTIPEKKFKGGFPGSSCCSFRPAGASWHQPFSLKSLYFVLGKLAHGEKK
jgi:hypothetical protein